MEPSERYDDRYEQHLDDEVSILDSFKKDGDYDYLAVARDAYRTSDDYFNANIRKQLEKNIAMFGSRHPAGSKYYQDAYKYRSKIFRPKTRSSVRRHEAAAALAFFSTADIVGCEAEDKSDDDEVNAARYAKALLSYRLEHSIDTFLTVIGAYQDAMVNGVVISRQEWEYKTKHIDEDSPVLDAQGRTLYDEDGNQAINSAKVERVIIDKPIIDLIAVENFRFDPACDWRDIVGTSPYLIELIPMYACDVRSRMDGENLKTGEQAWTYLSDGEIISADKTGTSDPTRMTREGGRADSHEQKHQLSMFDIVWVHRNIIKLDDEDMLFYTLGTEFMLSDPVPVKDVYLHGRPYAVGISNIETHKTYPAGDPELGQDLQAAANEVANQRLDNVKLVLNKRYRAKRTATVDWRALKSSVPGGIILMDNLSDVIEEKFTDVTGSSYHEQDRINVDYDELMGAFSSSSVATNRSLNETVGGMSMAKDDSNTITEYKLRVFTESWFEVVLRQLLEMERMYETDSRILAIAGGGEDPEKVAQAIQGNIKTRVAVGFGATAPHKRIEKLAVGLDTVGKYMPHQLQNINIEEVTAEVFGALGYRDGSRFFNSDKDVDPQVQQLQQEIQQLQQQIQLKQVEQQGKMQVEQLRAQGNIQLEQLEQQGDMQRDQLKYQQQMNVERAQGELHLIQQQIAAEGNSIKLGELQLQEKALLKKMEMEELQMLKEERAYMDGKAEPKHKSVIKGENSIEGDGLVDNMGSTVMQNDKYGMVPMAEG